MRSTFAVLLRLELLAWWRERSPWWQLLVLLWALGPPLFGRVEASMPDPFVEPRPAEVKAQSSDRCADLPPLAIDGALPPWLVLERGEPARTTVGVTQSEGGRYTFSVTGHREMAVRGCVEQHVRDERHRRLRALGLDVDLEQLAVVEVTVDQTLPRTIPLFATMAGLVGMVLAANASAEAVPRRRASGLLEQLRSTPTPAWTLLGAWLAQALVVSSISVGGMLLSYAAGAAWTGTPTNYAPLLHLPALLLVSAALGLWGTLAAEDASSASLRLALGLAGATMAGILGIFVDPRWAALIPVSGSVLACADALRAWSPLADLAAVAWTALMLAASARWMAREESTAPGAPLALLRQARGNYVPEVWVLASLGFAAAVMPASLFFKGDLVLALAIVFPTLMILPALATPAVLGVPARELLPFGRPRLAALVSAGLLSIGLAGLGPVAILSTMRALGLDPTLLAELTKHLDSLDTPLGRASVAFWPALAEELLFRGAILGLLLRSGRPGLALVGQAALFGLAHGDPLRLPWTSFVGLVLGWLRLRSGSLWAPMLLHGLFNGATAAVVPSMLRTTEALPTLPEASALLPLALCLLPGLALLELDRRLRRPRSTDSEPPQNADDELAPFSKSR